MIWHTTTSPMWNSLNGHWHFLTDCRLYHGKFQLCRLVSWMFLYWCTTNSLLYILGLLRTFWIQRSFALSMSDYEWLASHWTDSVVYLWGAHLIDSVSLFDYCTWCWWLYLYFYDEVQCFFEFQLCGHPHIAPHSLGI